jgi:hypothetical protein
VLSCVHQNGKKWSFIAKEMNSVRSEIAIKNRVNSIIKREKEFLISKIEQDPKFSNSNLTAEERYLGIVKCFGEL